MFKKILSTALCLSMLLSTAMPSFAAEITEATTGETIVTYGTSESFVVVIPSDFVISNNGTATANVKAMNVMLGANKSLEVSISGDDYVDSWELIDQEENSNRLIYNIGTSSGGNNIINNSVVLLVDAGEAYNSTITETLYFTVADELTKSGTYADTLTFEAVVLSNVLEGSGQTYHALAPSSLSFRSREPLNEFQKVKINGEVLDDENYSLTEGSTIVTLPVEYLETLEAGDYEIDIVSLSRTVSGRFSIVIPAENKYGFYYNQPYVANLPAFGGDTAFFVRTDGTYDIITVDKIPDTGTYTIEDNKISAIHPMLGEINCIISEDGTEIYCDEIQASFNLGSEIFAADDEYIYIYNDTTSGYGVTVIDNTKYFYDNIRSEINGIPVVEINKLGFASSENLNVAPKIPETIKHIGDGAFEHCYGLEQITIPKSVLSIGAYAFYSCQELRVINYEGTIEEWGQIFLGDNCFGMTNIEQIICSDGRIE